MNKIIEDYREVGVVEELLGKIARHQRIKDKRIRHGKTDNDRSSGAHKRRMANQQARNEYCQSNKSVNTNFPEFAARGNGNSSKRRKYYG